MKPRQREEAYWTDAYRAFFVNGNYGKFDDVLEKFKEAFPEYRAYLNHASRDQVDAMLQKAVRTVKKAFGRADHEERAAAPMPQQLRDAFLPFHVDVPPMSQSVNAFDGQGRLSMLDSSPKQHVRHQRHEKQHLREGFVYREAAERRCSTFLTEVEELLSDVPLVGDLPLREIMAILKQRNQSIDRDDDTTTTSPAPPAL